MTTTTDTTTTTSETVDPCAARPLVALYVSASALADAAEDVWRHCDCDVCAPLVAAQLTTLSHRELYVACAAYQVMITAEAARDAARQAWLTSDEPREWEFADSGCWDGGRWHRPSKVGEALREWLTDGDWDRSATVFLDARARMVDPLDHDTTLDDGQVDVTVTLYPLEPACQRGHTHEWLAPYEIVGGLKENPGVHGNGGGIVIREVCAHCARYKTTDTWAQHGVTQGLTSVSYEEADRVSLEWIEKRTTEAGE